MPASSSNHATYRAHIDILSASVPSYISRFSSFQGFQGTPNGITNTKPNPKFTSSSRSLSKVRDPFSVSESERAAILAKATAHADQYFDIVTRAYECNWDQNFHFAPFGPNDSISHALKFAVYRLALLLNLKPHHKVLDVGCGIGGPARELAKLVGCEVIGVTINQYQVNRAIELTAREGLGHKCTFINADFMDLPFPDNYFDAVFAFEATCHAPSLPHVYAQCWRVLKPGRQFGFTEQVMTDPSNGARYKYDETVEKHRDLRNRMEAGGGMACLQTASSARQALRRAGFEIELDEDYARYFDRLSGPVPFVFEDDESVLVPAAAGGTSPAQVQDKNACHWNGKRIKSFSPVLIPHRNGETSYLAPPPKPPYHAIISTSANPIPPMHRPITYPISGTKQAVSMASTAEDRRIVSDMTHSHRRWGYLLTKICVRLKLVPPGIVHLNKMLALYLDAIVEAVEIGIFTPSWMFVCRKMEGACEQELLKPLGSELEDGAQATASKPVVVPSEDASVLTRMPSQLSRDGDGHDGFRRPTDDLADMANS